MNTGKYEAFLHERHARLNNLPPTHVVCTHALVGGGQKTWHIIIAGCTHADAVISDSQ